ncbi:MAG TPA: phasin family protein [Anaerolineales bacterium]|nr:phasin family protein [Anaerolineales bacterium]
MTTQPPVMDETVEEHGQLYKVTRKVVLAALGVVGMATDELESFVDKLVERGEIAEKDGRKLIDEIREKSEERVKESRTRVMKMVGIQTKEEEDVEEVLHRMDIPSKSDIKELSAKIAALTRKVEELKVSKN